MFKSIVVPLDGSLASEHALPLALSLARRARAALHLAHVHVLPLALDERMAAAALELDKSVRKREVDYLERMAGRLTAHGSLTVSTAVLKIPIAKSLQDDAKSQGADLIVMTTHGRGPFSRFWLGSVADQLIRHLSVPIVLLRPTETLADLNAEPTVRRILIPLDGSALAEQVLGPAIELASLVKAECTLLQIIEPVTPVAFYPPGGEGSAVLDREVLESLHEAQAERERFAQAYLSDVASRQTLRGAHVQTQVVAHDQTATAILEEARAQNFDMVALATHGRGGLLRVVLGSVADKVVRGANVPVLVVRPRAQ